MKGNMNAVLHIGLRVGKISQLMKQVGSIGCLFYFFGNILYDFMRAFHIFSYCWMKFVNLLCFMLAFM